MSCRWCKVLTWIFLTDGHTTMFFHTLFFMPNASYPFSEFPDSSNFVKTHTQKLWFKSLQAKPGLNWMELLSLRYLKQPLCHLFKLSETDLERLYTDERMKIPVECETTPGEFEWKGRAVTEMGRFLDFPSSGQIMSAETSSWSELVPMFFCAFTCKFPLRYMLLHASVT